MRLQLEAVKAACWHRVNLGDADELVGGLFGSEGGPPEALERRSGINRTRVRDEAFRGQKLGRLVGL